MKYLSKIYALIFLLCFASFSFCAQTPQPKQQSAAELLFIESDPRVPQIVYEELKKWKIITAGPATIHKFTLPERLAAGPQWSVVSHACGVSGYNLNPYAGKSLTFVQFPINESERGNMLNVWVATDGANIACVYKTVREGAAMEPGVYSVDDPKIERIPTSTTESVD